MSNKLADVKFRMNGSWKNFLMKKHRKNFSQFLRDAVREKLKRDESKEVLNELDIE